MKLREAEAQGNQNQRCADKAPLEAMKISYWEAQKNLLQSGSFGLVKEDGKNFPLSYVLMFERYHPI